MKIFPNFRDENSKNIWVATTQKKCQTVPSWVTFVSFFAPENYQCVELNLRNPTGTKGANSPGLLPSHLKRTPAHRKDHILVRRVTGILLIRGLWGLTTCYLWNPMKNGRYSPYQLENHPDSINSSAGFAIITWKNPKTMEKPWITKGLATWQSLGSILSCNGWCLWWTPLIEEKIRRSPIEPRKKGAPGCLGAYVRDEILPSYIGSVINHYKYYKDPGSLLNNQYNGK